MTRQAFRINEHIERVGEVAVVLVLGIQLSAQTLTLAGYWYLPLVFVVHRVRRGWG